MTSTPRCVKLSAGANVTCVVLAAVLFVMDVTTTSSTSSPYIDEEAMTRLSPATQAERAAQAGRQGGYATEAGKRKIQWQVWLGGRTLHRNSTPAHKTSPQLSPPDRHGCNPPLPSPTRTHRACTHTRTHTHMHTHIQCMRLTPDWPPSWPRALTQALSAHDCPIAMPPTYDPVSHPPMTQFVSPIRVMLVALTSTVAFSCVQVGCLCRPCMNTFPERTAIHFAP